MTTNLHDKMLAAIDAYFSASNEIEAHIAEEQLLDVRAEINKQRYVPETNFGNMAEPKIGCVNHDCDKCKAAALDNGGMTGVEQDERVFARIEAMKKPAAQPVPVQEPVAEYRGVTNDGHYIIKPMQPLKIGALFYTAPPAAQPVPVKTYHDGKPWPVAPKPWVGLTDEEVMQTMSGDWTSQFYFARAIEAKLKEKNHG
jgi:hypothetical protein